MHNIAKLTQHLNGDVSLTVFRGGKRYTQRLSPDEANQLAYKLMSFTAGQQDQPFYLLRK